MLQIQRILPDREPEGIYLGNEAVIKHILS